MTTFLKSGHKLCVLYLPFTSECNDIISGVLGRRHSQKEWWDYGRTLVKDADKTWTAVSLYLHVYVFLLDSMQHCFLTLVFQNYIVNPFDDPGVSETTLVYLINGLRHKCVWLGFLYTHAHTHSTVQNCILLLHTGLVL